MKIYVDASAAENGDGSRCFPYRTISEAAKSARPGDEVIRENIGIFPAGEGPGYAGGIMSAAVDGLRVAIEIAGRHADCKQFGKEE